MNWFLLAARLDVHSLEGNNTFQVNQVNLVVRSRLGTAAMKEWKRADSQRVIELLFHFFDCFACSPHLAFGGQIPRSLLLGAVLSEFLPSSFSEIITPIPSHWIPPIASPRPFKHQACRYRTLTIIAFLSLSCLAQLYHCVTDYPAVVNLITAESPIT
jgi:hypothetical protein